MHTGKVKIYFISSLSAGLKCSICIYSMLFISVSCWLLPELKLTRLLRDWEREGRRKQESGREREWERERERERETDR